MKILQLLGHGTVGGTETFVISLVQGLNERGHDVTLVNTWTDSPLNAAAEAAGVPFTALRAGRRRIGPRWFWHVRRHLKRHRFDIVQTYGLRVSLGLRLMQRRLGVPHHVTGVRGLDQQRTGLQARWDRRTEHLLDMVICNAQAVARRRRELIGTPPSRIRVIPTGIDTCRFHPALPRPRRASLDLPPGFLFAMVGNFRPEKDHGTLLEALRIAGDELADARVVLLGRGLEEGLAAAARRLGVSHRLVFGGAVADVRGYLRAADAFVMSSSSEGMPRALMEAMAVGLPAVSTAAGGVVELAEHEKHALLVPTGDPAALAKGMIRLACDAELRAKLGRAASERICTDYSRARMLDRYIELFEGLLR